jgi:hypothetical protein
MKKSLSIIISTYFVLASATLSISAYQSTLTQKADLALAVNESVKNTYVETTATNTDQAVPTVVQKEQPPVLTAALTPDSTKEIQSKAAASTKQELSRGGDAIPKASEKTTVKTTGKAPAKTTAPSNSKVEVLDWWKQAKNVFKIGTTAVVQDVNSGKTFKIVRTMGSNHADCEAASKADADIIKSIWGGFSWDVRPVIVNVGSRRLAASMSSLPHAGVDSAPAFTTVDNRSEGYGRGDNLDVIKGNGMNGHFDVHFLNSTRHKDGQVDPRHQAAIKVAAKK